MKSQLLNGSESAKFDKSNKDNEDNQAHFLAVASEFAADNQGGTGGQEYGNYIHPERESENTRNEMNACIHYCGGNNYNALDEITKCTGRH